MDARTVVVFSHGSGSSMRSPRNRQVAAALNAAGHATLLFDLLTSDEGEDRDNVFDIRLLSSRLVEVTHWLESRPGTAQMGVGFFGASTGAAAALAAAEELGSRVGALVSRGGRPELAGDRLAAVVVPTLLIVGGMDGRVLESNRAAAARLAGPHEIVVVPGASHLFDEPGALELVAAHAIDWFNRHLR